MKYDYYAAVMQDIRDYLNDNYTSREIEDMDSEALVDELYDVDEVTGNGPYGYDYEEVVKDYVSDNMAFALECANDCGMTYQTLLSRPDHIFRMLDTAIRCTILYECIETVLNEYADMPEMQD